MVRTSKGEERVVGSTGIAAILALIKGRASKKRERRDLFSVLGVAGTSSTSHIRNN